MNRNVVTVIVSIALVLGVMLIVLANRNTSVAPTQDNGEGVATPVQSGTPPMSNTVKEITMTATSFEFDPPSITVKQGESVRLKIKSLDVTHGFMIPEFNVNSNLKPGTEAIVEFTPDKKGTYTFYCSVFCGHGHQDMKGTLTVE